MRNVISLSAAVLAVSLLSLSYAANAQSAAVAQTPPMGWNSWNYFAGRVTDKDIRDSADQIVASGMRDAGYIYVNIDDTWEGERDANGVLHSNEKFPDAGTETCAGFEGSLGHEEQDAQLYASWGIDYVKYDLCSFRTIMQAKAPDDKAAQMRLMIAAYDKMGKALMATGRPIVYSFCQYGWDSVWEWAMLAAPLLAGNDLPHMTPEIKAILTNREVIAIDQDRLGKQVSRVYSDGEVEESVQ